MKNKPLNKLTIAAMFSAISIILGYFAFPIFPQVAFLEYDLCDVVILIVSFICGPLYGIASSIVVATFQAFLLDKSGIFGFLMNIISTVSLILPAALIYARTKTKRSAIIALCCGTATLVVTMTAFNLLITPFFMNTTIKGVLGFMPFIVAFNATKSIINSLITFFVYKHISKFIKKPQPDK